MMGLPELVQESAEPSEETPIDLDRLRYAWRQVMAARTSAQHFNARLRRTTSVVAEVAVVDPHLVRALGVLTAMMANFSLAEDILGQLRMPNDLIEMDIPATEPEQDREDAAASEVAAQSA